MYLFHTNRTLIEELKKAFANPFYFTKFSDDSVPHYTQAGSAAYPHLLCLRWEGAARAVRRCLQRGCMLCGMFEVDGQELINSSSIKITIRLKRLLC